MFVTQIMKFALLQCASCTSWSMLMLVLLCSVTVWSQGFTATRALSGQGMGFVVSLNGKYQVLFDTGSYVTWVKSSTTTPGGYDTNGKVMVNQATSLMYPFGGSITLPHAVDESLWLGEIRWQQMLPIMESGGEWCPYQGVIGSSLNTIFAKTFRLFTLVPRPPSSYDIRVGKYKIKSRKCHGLSVAPLGVSVGKWIIAGAIQIGTSGIWEERYFEIDTGFWALALSHEDWEVFKLQMGARGATPSGYSDQNTQMFDNCSEQSVPIINYKFGSKMSVKLPHHGFATFDTQNRCKLSVTLHDVRSNQNVSYLGAPVLSSLISQFHYDEYKPSVKFCERP